LSEKSSEKYTVPPVQAELEQPQVPSDPQVVPQPPQLSGLLATLISQPFAPVRSQSRVVPEHATHELDMQDWLVVHCVGQEPQWRLSMVVFTSQPLPLIMSQSAVPTGQALTQVPVAQISPTPHGLLHPPQCWLEVSVFVSQPFAWSPSQLPKPGRHAPNVQVPVEHDSVAFAKSQPTPQPPQFDSVFVAVSHPLFGLPSQLM
jgi:hypothetical protein